MGQKAVIKIPLDGQKALMEIGRLSLKYFNFSFGSSVLVAFVSCFDLHCYDF